MIAEAKTTEEAYYDANGKRISKTMAWALSHVGFLDEVTDPEQRAQLVNFRNYNKQEDKEMNTETKKTEVSTTETTETMNKPKKGRMAWAMAHQGFIEVLDPELRSQMVNFRDENK